MCAEETRNRGAEGLAVAVLESAVEDSRSSSKRDVVEKAKAISFLNGETEGHRNIRDFWCNLAGINPAWFERKWKEFLKRNKEIIDNH